MGGIFGNMFDFNRDGKLDSFGSGRIIIYG